MKPPSSLQLLEGPFEIFPAGIKFSAVKVVARSGGIDVLANREGSPLSVMARHAAIVPATPSVTWSGPAVDLLPGVVGGTVAAADGDELEVCHNQFNGDPTSYSTFSGAYMQTTGPTMLFGGSSCEGLAFRDGKGLLALHKLGGGGCCSRPEVFDVDGKGTLLSKGPELALPDGEFGDIRLAAYENGFAWAGPVTSAGVGMHVRFRRATDTLQHTVPLDADAGVPETPDVAGWPFDAAAAVSFPSGTGMRLFVMHESGKLVLDEAIAAPDGDHIQRAPLGESPSGLVSSWARCRADFSATPGEIRVELRRPDQATLHVSIPVTCHAFVSTLAIVGDVIVVVYGAQDTLWGVVVKIVV